MEEPAPVVAERPLGWPYWEAVPVAQASGRAPGRPGLPVTTFEKHEGALAAWKELTAPQQEQLVAQGFTRVVPKARTFAVGDFYQQLGCEGVPGLVTIDALFAVALRAVGVAFAEAEAHVSSRAIRTLLTRLDVRLTDAEPRAHPDLTAGLHVAEGVVAVAMSLFDASYTVPPEVAGVVREELVLVRAHAGVTSSPLLHLHLDYSVFAPRGAAREDRPTFGAYLATEWLAAASFAFDGNENGGRDDVGAARARTRGALLIARLVAGSDADAPARQALHDLDQVDALTFGESAGTSPTALASLVVARGFDLHDAVAIGDAVRLDRIRRIADKAVGSMEIVPLRYAPETSLWDRATEASGVGLTPRPADIATWLAPAASPGQNGQAFGGHGSCYASALDALAISLSPSVGDVALPSTAGHAWEQEKVAGVLASWAALRHESVPYARSAAATPAPRDAVNPCPGKSARVLVEPHPEAIAAILGLVRQVDHGLGAIHAFDDVPASTAALARVESLLDLALRAAEEEAAPPSLLPRAPIDVGGLPSALAAIEARTTAAGGPFAAVVYSDAKSGRALEIGTTGLDALYVVVEDPRTRRPMLAVGAALSQASIWISANEPATDVDWAARLASTTTPPASAPFTRRVTPP